MRHKPKQGQISIDIFIPFGNFHRSNMPLETDQIIKVLSKIAKDEQMKVTVEQCVRGGLIAGGAATIGALLGGPFGLAAAATAGGLIAAKTSTKFLSVFQVLENMEPEKKECLAEDVRQILRKAGVTDVLALMSLSAAVKQDVTNALTNYFQNKMKMKITYR